MEQHDVNQCPYQLEAGGCALAYPSLTHTHTHWESVRKRENVKQISHYQAMQLHGKVSHTQKYAAISNSIPELII